jgi:hypothetical protein
MTPTIRLHHFLRGEVEVQAETVDGRREWSCPDRPMMRPWPDCYFLESPDEIEARLAMATAQANTAQSFQRGRLEDAARGSDHRV